MIRSKSGLSGIAAFLLILCPASPQTGDGRIRGKVTDPSGRSIPDAQVTLRAARGALKTTRTDTRGRYGFVHLAPGSYNMRASAKGFTPLERTQYEVKAGVAQVLDFPLSLASVNESVTVQDTAHVDVDPSSNADAIVLRGKQLDALSDDRDDLAADLAALAGPGAGPNGGQIYIDGFTGGRLPPKASIREVRTNQNPFSAQYDRSAWDAWKCSPNPAARTFTARSRRTMAAMS